MNHEHTQKKESYWPLVVIISLIFVVTLVLALRAWNIGTFHWIVPMQYFMAGFFLVFSGFKFLDLPGFVQGYSQYDLLARRVRNYGYVYPFLELGIGLLYLVGYSSPLFYGFTFLLMIFSGIGVALKIAKREKFTCACLGTLLNVPLTKITLIEDFGMAAMALVMIVM